MSIINALESLFLRILLYAPAKNLACSQLSFLGCVYLYARYIHQKITETGMRMRNVVIRLISIYFL